LPVAACPSAPCTSHRSLNFSSSFLIWAYFAMHANLTEICVSKSAYFLPTRSKNCLANRQQKLLSLIFYLHPRIFMNCIVPIGSLKIFTKFDADIFIEPWDLLDWQDLCNVISRDSCNLSCLCSKNAPGFSKQQLVNLLTFFSIKPETFIAFLSSFFFASLKIKSMIDRLLLLFF
jgi:hypothetical protein